MLFTAEIVNLALFCAQQFGVALGIGAQTVLALLYLQSLRDGSIDEKESQFLRLARSVLFASFIAIVLSGIAITALHILGGTMLLVLTPAYLFKWLLIAVLVVLTLAAGSIPRNIFEALITANWYALFIVHTLAPVASWMDLLLWWGVWLVGFSLCWYAVSFMSKERKHAALPAKIESPQKAKEIKKEEPAPVAPAPIPAPAPTPKKEEAQKPEPPKIILDTKPPLELPKELPKEPVSAEPSKITPITPVSNLKIEPTEIPMPAPKATDTPFLPKVPPLQPIPVQPQQGGSAPKPEEPAKLAEAAQTPPQADSLAIRVMPKSPDQVPKQ